MDIKNRPPISTPGTTTMGVDPSRLQKGSGPTAAESSRATSASPTGATVDTHATSELVSIGRTEAMALHEQAIAKISEEIASGTYKPDLNVVAERVAEVLGAV